MTDTAITTYGTFDPRASRIGKVLRQSGADELPQLANVILGDMSLVGIRPVTDAALERMESADAYLFDEWNDARKSIPLGLTGLSQIYRHYHKQVTHNVDREAMELDIQYGETASFRQDVAIIGRTPFELMKASLQNIYQQPSL